MDNTQFCSINDLNANYASPANSYLDLQYTIETERLSWLLNLTSVSEQNTTFDQPNLSNSVQTNEEARDASQQLAQLTQKQNTQRIIPTPLGLLLSLTGCSDSTKGGATLTVNCSALDYYSIQDAVNDATDGDTIEVCEEEYPNSGFTVDKSLIIRARDGHSPEIDLSYSDEIYFADANYFTLSGFKIYSAEGYAIRVFPSNDGDVEIDLSNLVIYDSFGGIVIGSYSVSSNIELNNIEIYNNKNSGILIKGTSEGPLSIKADNLNLHDNAADPDAISSVGLVSILSANASIINSAFANNIGYYGAAIYIDGTDLILTDTTFENNTAINPDGIGGALQLAGSEFPSTVTATNTNWGGTNTPFDVSIQNPKDSTVNPDYGYSYGTGVSFECEYEVSCADL